jgi:phosphatidylinositol alpha-mannosyltransferase
MKIAFITTYDFASPGGVRNHIIQLANAFIQQGHTVQVLAPASKPVNTDFKGSFVPIITFPSAAKSGCIPPHLLIGLKAIRHLQALLKQESFDIVHIHEPLLPPFCLSALILTKSPLFATFHTYYEKGQPLYRLFKPILGRFLTRLQGRIAVSTPAKNYIEQYFPYDYCIIPNGVNIEKFSSRTHAPSLLTPGYFHVLFVGHAQFKRKGLRYLINAYRILKNAYPQLRLVVAGSQWFGRQAHVDSHLQDVRYLGTVTDEQLITLYQTADLFCAPSTGNESFGMVLTEAMAAGIPILTTQIKGYQQVVTHEKDALLVPPKDSFALANAIKRFIDEPELGAELAKQAKITVQRYDWSNIAIKVMDYYKTCKSPGNG